MNKYRIRHYLDAFWLRECVGFMKYTHTSHPTLASLVKDLVSRQGRDRQTIIEDFMKKDKWGNGQ